MKIFNLTSIEQMPIKATIRHYYIPSTSDIMAKFKSLTTPCCVNMEQL